MSRSETFCMICTGLVCAAVCVAIDAPLWVCFVGSAIVGGIGQRIYARVTR